MRITLQNLPDENPIPYPDGHVTFLFTDIKGSTETVRQLSRHDYQTSLLDPHLKALREVVTGHRGCISGTPAGDSIMAAFKFANDAVDCAIAIQQKLSGVVFTDSSGKTWTQPVRIGVHTAKQQVTPDSDGLYLQDEDVIYTARIMAVAHGEQIVVSASAYQACDARRWPNWVEWPNRRIKDWNEEPQILYELAYDGKRRGEPGAQFLPEWFREANSYIPRRELENAVLDLFRKKTVSGNNCRLVTLHGFGGMGKTRLGAQCCVQAAGIFNGRLHSAKLDGVSDEDPTDEKVQLEYLTDRIARAFAIAADVTVTPKTLADLLPGEARLLLLDNYESVAGRQSALLLQRMLLARPDLHILVTGRELVGLDSWEFPKTIESLLPDAARELLLERARQMKGDPAWSPTAAEKPAVSSILELTDRIPLALEIVAAHLKRNSLANIAASLAREPLGMMSGAPRRDIIADGSERHQSLERCLNWSWKLLGAPARHALMCLSLFANDCAEEELTDCFPEISIEDLYALQDAALITRREEAGGNRYALLRPTRAYARKSLIATDQDTALRRQFIEHYRRVAEENGGEANLEDATKLARLLAAWPHIGSVIEVAAEAGNASLCGDVTDNLIHFVNRRALYSEAVPTYLQAADVLRKSLPVDHPDIANSLNNLAGLYESQGRYSEAEPRYKEALQIRQASLPAGHPDIATSLNNLAGLYESQGRYADAEPLYQQALKIRQSALPAGHPSIANSLNNLAGLYESQGRYADAEPLYQQALKIRQSALPERHPDIATSLNNLAGLYESQGRYADAEPLYQQALKIRQSALPAGHPSIANSLNNLAGLYESQGRYADAEPLYQQALKIRQSALPERHPDIATSLNNLAGLYESQGRYADAEPLYKEALGILRKGLPVGHPHIGFCLDNLVRLYRKQGRDREAEALLENPSDAESA